MVPVIELLEGVVDGNNCVFETRSTYLPGSVRVFYNGQLKRQDLVDGWTELGGKKVFLKEAPLAIHGYVDVLQAYYIPSPV